MPVFNDFSHYYVGGGHSTTPTYTSSGYSGHLSSSASSTSSPYSYPSPYSNRTHSNYFPSNYPSSNLLSTITGSGITARYYTGNPKKNSNFAYNYKGTRANYSDKYNDSKSNAYSPSPYSTYSLWKENQIASKWRNDNYRWNHLKDGPRTTKPVFIDTAKINVNKPRTKREEPPAPEPIPERSVLVEKPMVRDDQLGTIKRGRTVVRMHTKMLKENPYLKKNENSDHSEEDEEGLECKFNRMSPVRISRLKKRSVLQYKRHDSGNKHWLDSESSDNESTDSENCIPRKNTVKSRKISRSGTIKRDDTVKSKDEITREDTVKRRYNTTTHSKDLSQSIDAVHKTGGEVKKADRRLSLEMYEEQSAIFDSMIKAELAREDADDYFSDPKRGTVKIKGKNNTAKTTSMGQSTDSNTDDEDTKKKGRRLSRSGHQKNDNEAECASERSTPSSSRRNSLFQDLIIGETISETFIEDLENKIQNSYTNTETILKDSMPKLRLGTVKITQKLAKKPSRFEIQPSNSDAKISAIVEVEEKPKTPKFFIEDVKIEASKFSFEDDKKLLNAEVPQKDKDISNKIEKTEKVIGPKQTAGLLKKEPPLEKHKKDTNKPSTVETNNNVFEIKSNASKMNSEKTELTIPLLKSKLSETTLIPKCDNFQNDLNTKNGDDLKAKLNESNNSTLFKTTSDGENDKKSSKLKACPEIPPTNQSFTEVINETHSAYVDSTTKEEVSTINLKSEKHESEIVSEKQNTSSPQKEIKLTEQKLNENNKTNVEKVKTLPIVPTKDKIIRNQEAENLSKITEILKDKIEINEKTKDSLKDISTTVETEITADAKQGKELNQKPKIPSPVNTIKKDKTAETTSAQRDIKKDITAEIISQSPPKEDPKTSQDKNVSKIPSPVNTIKKDKTAETTSAQRDNKKDITAEIISPSPPKDDPKTTREKNVSSVIAKPKINLESNKKNSKMKDEKPERKTVKASQKDSMPIVDEKERVEKLENTEEKSEAANQNVNARKVTAKKSAHKKKESSRPRKPSAIVHMKPRAMAIRTVENHPPSLKTPRLFPLPQPTKAVIEIIPSTPFEESESSDDSDDESTATEGSSEESSETSSDDSSSSLQGNLRNSTSSLDSGFGSACYKTRKGIALQIRIVY